MWRLNVYVSRKVSDLQTFMLKQLYFISGFNPGPGVLKMKNTTDLDRVALLSPIRTDHLIIDKFKAENDTNYYIL